MINNNNKLNDDIVTKVSGGTYENNAKLIKSQIDNLRSAIDRGNLTDEQVAKFKEMIALLQDSLHN